MSKVHLGFKAFDIHELLCHFMALRGGIYQQQGLQVRLIDTTFIADDQLPPRTIHAACGAVLLGYLNGAPYKVILVNTDHPMFWLYHANGVSNVAQLKGNRVASYPAMAPPAHFLAALVSGVDLHLLPVSTDVARLGLLKCGDVDAALISSALPPAIMARHGFNNALLLGDEFRAPSTGLAVNSEMLGKEPELVASMVSAHQQSLTHIHNDDVLLRQVLNEQFGLPVSALEKTMLLVRELFTSDGRSDEAVGQQAIAAVAAQLGVVDLPTEPLYDYSLLTG